jgi:beta-lactamase class A
MKNFQRWTHRLLRWGRLHKRQLAIAGGTLMAIVIVAQLLYPSDRLLPFASIDKVSVSGWQKKDAAWQLDQLYKKQPINLYFGKNTDVNYKLAPSNIGLTVHNSDRVNAVSYPWYMRLIPTSALWYGRMQTSKDPSYDRNKTTLDTYMQKELGGSCNVKPVDASVKAQDAKLVIVPSSNGGTCNPGDVVSSLSKLRPVLTQKTQVRVAMDEIPPTIDDNQAKELVKVVNKQLETGVSIVAGNQTVKPDSKTVAGWLDAAVVEGKLTVAMNSDRAAEYLNKEVAPKVAQAPGVTKVTTVDFQETSRQNGPNGLALDVGATGSSLVQYLTARSQAVNAAVQPVPARVEYTRSYSPTDAGLSALMTNYAKDHPGTFGVQLIELSGKRRRAAYNESHQFVTASTYKLFVGYGTLKKIEANEWQWSNVSAGGRDTATCFDDMIVKSDNACAEALLERYGYNNLTRDIRALGLSSASGFIGDTPKSTAADLGLFMAMLESGQLPIQPANRDRFIGALKRNVYRQGIPAGASGTVADKVGFLNGLFHDAAIVYSPSGTYVLVIMTDGSSWANIAELTKQIDALRNQ